MNIMDKSVIEGEQQLTSETLIQNLIQLKDDCIKNGRIFGYLIEKFGSWQNLLERNKDQPVELQYPHIIESSKKYFQDIRSNYQNILSPQLASKNQPIFKEVKPVQTIESLNQIINTNQLTNTNSDNKTVTCVKKAVFRVKPKVNEQQPTNYQRCKHALKKYVQNNYRITPYPQPNQPPKIKKLRQRGRKRKEIEQNTKPDSNEEEQILNSNSNNNNSDENQARNQESEEGEQQQESQKYRNKGDAYLNNQNNEMENNANQTSAKTTTMMPSSIYEINNPLLTKNDMSLKKIMQSYIENKTGFDEYYQQILEFEQRFNIKVPSFFKDREIHHYRMLMNNYQLGLLTVSDLIQIKKLIEVSENQRLVGALLLISQSVIRHLLKKLRNIDKIEEELLIEKEVQETKEKNYESYIEQILEFEKLMSVKLPLFFKNKQDFLRRDYYEKRFCLAVSNDDCIQIYIINRKNQSLKGHQFRRLNQLLLITESQLQLILRRASDLIESQK